MLKAVIFDMDGVILDSEPLHKQAIGMLLEKLGISSNEVLKDKPIGTSYEAIWEMLIRECDIGFTMKELMQMQHECSCEYFNRIELEETKGLSEFINDLTNHEISIAIGSCSPIDLIGIILKKLDLQKYMDVICGMECVSRPKPAPDIFLWTAEALEISPEHCLVIEDSPYGITAAKDAGMKCMALRNQHTSEDDVKSADRVFTHFSDIDYYQAAHLFDA